MRLFSYIFSPEKDDWQNQKLFEPVTSNMFHFSLLPLLKSIILSSVFRRD